MTRFQHQKGTLQPRKPFVDFDRRFLQNGFEPLDSKNEEIPPLNVSIRDSHNTKRYNFPEDKEIIYPPWSSVLVQNPNQFLSILSNSVSFCLWKKSRKRRVSSSSWILASQVTENKAGWNANSIQFWHVQTELFQGCKLQLHMCKYNDYIEYIIEIWNVWLEFTCFNLFVVFNCAPAVFLGFTIHVDLETSDEIAQRAFEGADPTLTRCKVAIK